MLKKILLLVTLASCYNQFFTMQNPDPNEPPHQQPSNPPICQEQLLQAQPRPRTDLHPTAEIPVPNIATRTIHRSAPYFRRGDDRPDDRLAHLRPDFQQPPTD